MEESFKTLQKSASDEFEVKRSRFIGYASPVKTEEEALLFISGIKQKHWDAKHNVYAYRLRNGGIMRFSDDGEPQGTAGMPVLNVISKEEITDCVVVVTRYFGGILLGGGGLVRAYSHAAKLALDVAGITVSQPWRFFRLLVPYSLYSHTQALVLSFDGVMCETLFSENVDVTFRIKKEKTDAFLTALADAFGGKLSCETLGDKIL